MEPDTCICGHSVSWHGSDDLDVWPCNQCDCLEYMENQAEPLFDLDNDQ